MHARGVKIAMRMSKVSRIPTIWIAIVVAAGLGRASSQAVPRTDANSIQAHAQLKDKTRQGRIDVYFAGDSITRRWGTSDAQYRDLLANWRQNFFGWNAADFGWGGDTVQNVLWRLEDGEFDGVRPNVVVLMAGTNNIADTPRTAIDSRIVDEIASGIRAILELVQHRAPEATIVVMGITPRLDRQGGPSLAPTIAAANARIGALADGRRVRFLDLNGALAAPDGAPHAGMTVDGLHLTVAGYQVWADALKPILTEILGPPATTDHAPPPSGNPADKQPRVRLKADTVVLGNGRSRRLLRG